MLILDLDLQAGTADGFTAADRAIFPYGGGSSLHADPLAIERRHDAALAQQNPDSIGRWLRERNYNRSLLAFRRLVPVAHAALGTTPLDEATGAGLTGPEVLAILDRFRAFRRRLTAEFRATAEMVATYGASSLGPMSYRRHCGLWWNRHRVQAIAGVNMFRGMVAAQGGAFPFLFADAMATSLDEAFLVHEQIELDRAQAEAKAEFQAARHHL